MTMSEKLLQTYGCAIRVSVDALCALHDCALGISPVTSYSGVKVYYKRMDVQPTNGVHCARCVLDATAPSVLAVPMFTHKSVSTFSKVLLLC